MLKTFNSRLVLSAGVIAVAAAFIIGATFAIFSDTETSEGNVLAAGALDLKIDNTSYYNGVLNEGTTWELDDLTDQLFFDFTDVKPSDVGEDTISLHAENDAWVCADFSLTENDDVSCVPNETPDDLSCTEPNGDLFDGELAQNIEFAFWSDDGDNVLEDDEEIISSGSADQVLDGEITIADSITNNIGGDDGDPMTGGDDIHYIAKAWCFGDLGFAPVPTGQGVDPTVDGGVTCDGSLLNEATQSDRVMADVTFTAVQARNNPDFTCEPPEVTPTLSPTPTPIPFACEAEDAILVNSFSSNDQGRQKSGAAVLANRSNPAAAFSIQSSGLPVDPAVPAGSFFALGFPNVGTSSATASIVYGFPEQFFNGPGGDLIVYEVTGATTPAYPDEIVKVEVGPTSVGPWTVVAAGAIRDELIDISPVVSAQYVRLTDVSNIALFPNDADGYDVDAVQALCTEVDN